MKIILHILLVLLLVSCSTKNKNLTNTATNNLSGKWEWKENNLAFTFDIYIKQTGDSITGNYCAIANNGNKIDCSVENDDNCNMYGKQVNNVTVLTFTSCYMEAKGEAIITYNPKKDELIWKLGNTTDIVFAPDSAILKRRR